MSGPGARLSTRPDMTKSQRSWMPNIWTVPVGTRRRTKHRGPRPYTDLLPAMGMTIASGQVFRQIHGGRNLQPIARTEARRFACVEPLERRLAAIVCADIAGYSRMMGADEAGTHASFKAHRSAIYPIILNHGGRLVKNTGDGFLLEFPSIVGAIEAAVAMQNVMTERNHHLPTDRVMHFRMGIHMGDVMTDEDELFGDDVNIAVRLQTVAAPGGIAVSDKACTEAGRRLTVTLAEAGPHRFKNIAEPVDVWTWVPPGLEARGRDAQENSLPGQYRTAIVGVLPFDNLSGSADEY